MKLTGFLSFVIFNVALAAVYFKKECLITQRYEEKVILQQALSGLYQKQTELEKQLESEKNLTKIRRYATRVLKMRSISRAQLLTDST